MRDVPPVLRTALWLAGARVLEMKRPHPLVTDVLAERLLGEAGLEIALSLERAHPAPRAIIRRVRLVDELVTRYVKDRRIEAVIMAGTGLDARPYRLDLPSSLTWIEIDFPVVTDWKNERLRDVRPHCVVERAGVDLMRPGALATAIGDRCAGKRTLVLVENLFQYFSTRDTQLFFRDTKCFTPGAITIADIPNSAFVASKLGREMSIELENRDVQGRTAIDNVPAFMTPMGFRVLETHHVPCLGDNPVAWTAHRCPWWMPNKKADLLRVVVMEKE
ncbi:MAG TPA: class I SAM-dependent methyltransferase [Candidatus Methylomirabilis sp.]|nr:class I SAM-dependent methyltransferase [Candidatus Methylomirabilis sp.]